jgi:hypothetical protein
VDKGWTAWGMGIGITNWELGIGDWGFSKYLDSRFLIQNKHAQALIDGEVELFQ